MQRDWWCSFWIFTVNLKTKTYTYICLLTSKHSDTEKATILLKEKYSTTPRIDVCVRVHVCVCVCVCMCVCEVRVNPSLLKVTLPIYNILMCQENTTLIFANQCSGDIKCSERVRKQFVTFFWRLTVTFCWCLVVNKVVFKWNMSMISAKGLYDTMVINLRARARTHARTHAHTQTHSLVAQQDVYQLSFHPLVWVIRNRKQETSQKLKMHYLETSNTDWWWIYYRQIQAATILKYLNRSLKYRGKRSGEKNEIRKTAVTISYWNYLTKFVHCITQVTNHT
jgi:hypothetical protein